VPRSVIIDGWDAHVVVGLGLRAGGYLFHAHEEKWVCHPGGYRCLQPIWAREPSVFPLTWGAGLTRSRNDPVVLVPTLRWAILTEQDVAAVERDDRLARGLGMMTGRGAANERTPGEPPIR
jgi:hypothetical protein